MCQVNNPYCLSTVFMDYIVVSLKEADSQWHFSQWQCHLEVLRFEPIAPRAELLAQQRKTYLSKHTHSLIKTAKGDQRRISFLLKLHANFSVKIESDPSSHLYSYCPKGYHQPGKVLLINTLQFSHKEDLKSPPTTQCLYLYFHCLTSFPWRCHLQLLTENYAEPTWLCPQFEIFHCHPFKSEHKKYARAWVNTSSFPTKLPGTSLLQNLSHLNCWWNNPVPKIENTWN